MAITDDGRIRAYASGRRNVRLAAALARLPGAVRKLRTAGVLAVAALMLMWSAVVNGRPSVFPDTALYYSQAEYLAQALGAAPPANLPAGDPTALPRRPGAPNVSATIDGARSPIYGLFLLGLERMGGLWLVALGQGAIIAYVLRLLYRAALPGGGEGLYLGWMAILSAATSLPYFASFTMPDVFAGVAGAAALAILVYWDRLSASGRVGALAVLAFALAVHRSNLVMTALEGGLGLAVLISLGLPARAAAVRAAAVWGAVAAALALGALAFAPIDQRAGEIVRDPPFLMARVLADGPGRRFLAHACAHGQPFAACRFQRLPPEDSDTLLWSGHPATGFFGVADYRTRLRLEAEEPAFVLATVAYDPAGQALASSLNVLRQLGMSEVRSPLADPSWLVTDAYWRRTSFPRIIPGAAACTLRGRCASRIPVSVANEVQDIALFESLCAALAAAAWILACPGFLAALRRRALPPGDDRARLLAMLALTGGLLIVNAVICGALSAPVPRYQARLVWLAPAVAMLCGAVLWRRRGSEAGNQGPADA